MLDRICELNVIVVFCVGFVYLFFVTFAYKITSKFNINSIRGNYEENFIFRHKYLNRESHIKTIVTTKKKLQKRNKEEGTNKELPKKDIINR